MNAILESARRLAMLALEKKAENIIILDLRKLTSIADYFVICSVETDVQVKSIVNHIRDNLKGSEKPMHIEGSDHNSWVLLDFVDVVMHVFQTETREYFNIEGLWADAEKEVFASDER